MTTRLTIALVLMLSAALPLRAEGRDDEKVPLAAAAAGGGLLGSGLGAVGGFMAVLVAVENDASLSEVIPGSAEIGAPIVDFWGPIAIGMVVGAVVGAGVAGVLVGVPVSPAPLTAGAGVVCGGALLAVPGLCCFGGLFAAPEPVTDDDQTCLIYSTVVAFCVVIMGNCLGSLLGAAAGGAAGGAMVPSAPNPAQREVPPPAPIDDDVTTAPAPAPPAPRR